MLQDIVHHRMCFSWYPLQWMFIVFVAFASFLNMSLTCSYWKQGSATLDTAVSRWTSQPYGSSQWPDGNVEAALPASFRTHHVPASYIQDTYKEVNWATKYKAKLSINIPLTVILLLNLRLCRCPICRTLEHYRLKAFRHLPVNLKWPTPYFLIYTLLIAVHQLSLSLLDSSCLVRSPDGGPSSSLIMPSLQRSVSKNLCACFLLWWCIEFVPSFRRTRAYSRLGFSLGFWGVGETQDEGPSEWWAGTHTWTWSDKSHRNVDQYIHISCVKDPWSTRPGERNVPWKALCKSSRLLTFIALQDRLASRSDTETPT